MNSIHANDPSNPVPSDAGSSQISRKREKNKAENVANTTDKVARTAFVVIKGIYTIAMFTVSLICLGNTVAKGTSLGIKVLCAGGAVSSAFKGLASVEGNGKEKKKSSTENSEESDSTSSTSSEDLSELSDHDYD